jgi:hypothetical protein
LIGPSQKNYTFEFLLEVFIGGWSAFPLDEKEKNFGQSIWDKNMRTYWELGKPLGNKKKTKNIPLPPNQIWGP